MLDDDLRIPPPGYRSAPQRRAEEMRRMLMIAGGAGVLLLVCIIGYFAATGSGSQGVQVIQAPTTPVKVKPENPGGLTITTPSGALPGDGSQNVAIAPPPEKPDPAALAAQAKQEQQQAMPLGQTTAAKSASGAASGSQSTSPAAAPAPAVSIPSVPETAAPTGQKQTAMAVPPPSKELAKPRNLAQEYTPPSGSSAGGVKVQLAALGSREAAQRAWDHLTQKMPGILAGRHPLFVEATVNGHTYWRVRLAGFRSKADAAQFCQSVRAHGGACDVAAF
ncbi:SPOR domain-containing protein [Acidisoma sp. 7E03]